MPLWIWQVIAWTLIPAGFCLLLWALFRDRSRGRERCPNCWYDMAGTIAVEGRRICPECGRHNERDKDLRRTRRRWRPAALAAFLGLLGAGAMTVPAIQRGWAAVIPSSILVYVAPATGYTPPPTLPAGFLASIPAAQRARLTIPVSTSFAESMTKEVWDRLDKGDLAAWQERAYARRLLAAAKTTLDGAYQVPDRWVRGQKLPFRIAPRGLWGLLIEAPAPGTVPTGGTSFRLEQTVTLSFGMKTIMRQDIKRDIGIADSWEFLLAPRAGPEADQATHAALDPCLVTVDDKPTVLLRDRSESPQWSAVSFAIAAVMEVKIGDEVVGRGRFQPQWIRSVWKDWEEPAIEWVRGAQDRLKTEPATLTLRGEPVPPDEFIDHPFDHRSAAYWAGELTVPLTLKPHPGGRTE